MTTSSKNPSGGFLDLLPAVIERVMAGHRLLEEKLQAEETLRESELRFRTVAETTADAIICFNADGGIIMWNSAAERMFGYQQQEALGMNGQMLIPADLRPTHDIVHPPAPIADGAETATRFETLGQRKNESSFPIKVSATSWQAHAGTFVTAIIRDITERKEYEEKLAHIAHHDSLTGIFNRHHLAAVLKLETDRALRYNHPIGFLMIDVNRFKTINDTLGHHTGDQVIKAVAKLIQSSVRRVDLTFRYREDEFLIVLPETDGNTRFVKEHILATVEQWNQTSDLLDFDLTLSIGVSHWIPGEDQTTDDALREADHATYEDKQRQ